MITLFPGRAIRQFRVAYLTFVLGTAGLLGAQEPAAQTNAPEATAYRVPILVGNLELDSAGPKSKPPAGAAEVPKKEIPGSAPVYGDSDAPSAQARRLTEFFTASLLQALNRKGFSAARTDGDKAAATGGVLIRGVFAEPDARNRIRRALLGGSSPNAKFLLYVGIFDAARQDQPLYQLAPVAQPQSERYGPVITLNAYVPLAKYELDKNPSEEDVKKICEQIVESLVSLLERNPHAFSQ